MALGWHPREFWHCNEERWSMKGRLVRVLALMLAVYSLFACGQSAPADRTMTSGTGGSGGIDGAGGAGGASCTDPQVQCPDPMNECVVATCVAGACGTMPVVADTPTVTGQLAGDCQKQVCDGSGDAKVVDDAADPGDDLNPCTM